MIYVDLGVWLGSNIPNGTASNVVTPVSGCETRRGHFGPALWSPLPNHPRAPPLIGLVRYMPRRLLICWANKNGSLKQPGEQTGTAL